ncbi:hypothetical protein JCM10213_004390 [Rhodosporidiobolus nylandii]
MSFPFPVGQSFSIDSLPPQLRNAFWSAVEDGRDAVPALVAEAARNPELARQAVAQQQGPDGKGWDGKKVPQMPPPKRGFDEDEEEFEGMPGLTGDEPPPAKPAPRPASPSCSASPRASPKADLTAAERDKAQKASDAPSSKLEQPKKTKSGNVVAREPDAELASSSTASSKAAASSNAKKKPASPPASSYPDADESDDDMPPHTQSGWGGSAGKKEKDIEVKEPEFARGTVESKLFDWDFEDHGKGIEGAYKLLGWRKGMSDDEVVKKAEEIMGSERSSQRSGKSTSSRLGAVLLIVCSRASTFNAFPAASTSHSIARVLRLLYLSEAQLHLAHIRLPLPPGAYNPSDIDLRVDAAALEQLEAEKAAHDATKKRLQNVQASQDKATSGATVARAKADKNEQEAKGLRAEVSKLKNEKEELKLQSREGWEAKKKLEDEAESAQLEVKRWKREAQASRASSVPNISTIPSGIGADKKDFVISKLSQQVSQLNMQLKEKNEELVKLMYDMSDMASGGL